MKKSVTLIFLSVLLAITLHSNAKQYVGIKGGLAHTSIHNTKAEFFGPMGTKLEDAPIFGAIWGYKINEIFRFDVETSHRFKSNSKYYQGSIIDKPVLFYKSAFSATGLILNGYVEAQINSNIRPFITFGIGTSYNKLFDTHVTITNSTLDSSLGTTDSVMYKGKSKFSLALQGGVGISFYQKNFVFDGEIKYIDRGKIHSNKSLETGIADSLPAKYVQTDLKEILFLTSIKYYL